jgi:hypothetical protein
MRSEFEENGYVILKGFFSPDVMRGVRAEAERIVERVVERLKSEGLLSDTLSSESFETRLIPIYERCGEHVPKLFNQQLHVSGMFDFFFNGKLLDIVESFLGTEIRLYPNYYLRPKMPGDEAFQVLWHQDAAYTDNFGSKGNVEALRTVNCWASLVPARVENGCMQFIPGSHKLGLVPYTQKKHYLEISPEHLDPHLSKSVNIEMDPGDVVLFHNLLFHQGLPNHSKTIRWSLDWRYQDATQPTMRPSNGHLARTQREPGKAVVSADQWTRLASA